MQYQGGGWGGNSIGTGAGISTCIDIGTGIGTRDTDGNGYNEIMSNLVVASQPVALVLAKCNDIRRTVIVLVHMQPCGIVSIQLHRSVKKVCFLSWFRLLVKI